MSEFRIIKCSSCDAPLVEMKGKKVKKCVQCGHNLSSFNKSKSQLINITAQMEKAQSNTFEQKNDNNSAPQVATKTKTSANTTTNTTAKKLIPKKSKSIIGTIIGWYIFIYIASKLLKEFF